jgi:zinc transporter 1/2/3
MDDVAVFKLVSLVCIWLVGLAGGLIPARLAARSQRSPSVRRLLSVLTAFSGGVFLAGGFFHLLHSAIENPALRRWSTVDGGRYEFPYAEMFCTLGFLALLLLEQAAHAKMHQASAHGSAYSLASKDDDDDLELRGADESDDTYMDDLDDDEQEQEQERATSVVAGSNVKFKRRAGHTHGHAHLGGSNSGSLAVAMVLFVALSFHSVLEGLGIGAQTEAAWGVFLAIVLHKGLAAFALGSGLVQSAMPAARVTLYMVVFSFMSIVGILVGWAVTADSSEDSAAAGICVALASGTFIYVAVMEVIPQEFPRSGKAAGPMDTTKMAALCIGYAVFGLLAKWS